MLFVVAIIYATTKLVLKQRIIYTPAYEYPVCHEECMNLSKKSTHK